jgi:di/tricarboxylate transporter
MNVQTLHLLIVFCLVVAVITAFLRERLSPDLVALSAMGVLLARPFAVAVMFGCAASFATPIGHQTNTYVFGAGGYRFADFPRIGVPLNLILWVVASVLIPIFWPFVPK